VYDCVQLGGSEETFGLACHTELLSSSVYECKGYRLPTSAEWEYAARAGTTTAFYTGDITSFEDNYACNDDPNLSPVAWYCANAGPPERPVAQLVRNQWGLHDVLGNVKEWTLDRARGAPTPDPSADPEADWDTIGAAITRSCAVNGLHAYCRVAAGLESSRDARAAGIRLVRTLGKGTLPTLDGTPVSDAGSEPPDASVVDPSAMRDAAVGDRPPPDASSPPRDAR
jgi:hypothetical protein